MEDLNPWWKEPGERLAQGFPVRRGVHNRLLTQLLRITDRRAQVLMGPRQVGKTTLLKQLSDDLLARGWPPRNLTYVDLEDFRFQRNIEPEEIAHLRPPGVDPDQPQVFLLDEIHRVARWDRWLKYAVDSQLGRIVVTDSAASLLREAGRESGLGRWDNVVLEGLSFREFIALSPAPEMTALERYLRVGGFPAHAAEVDYRSAHQQLREDIVEKAIYLDLESRVDDPERLRKLFVYLIQQSGGEHKPKNRADDLDVDRRTVAKWIELLANTLLIAELSRGSMSAKASSRLRGRPKLYAADHGLVTAFAAMPQEDSEVRSKVFETVVYRHLRELAAETGGDLHYLKWGQDLEVDFLVDIGGQRAAIEVTHSVQPKAEKRERLARAADRAGAGRAVLVHGGLAQGEVADVVLMPIGSFLADPRTAVLGGDA